MSEWEPSIAFINAFDNAYLMTLSTHENKQVCAFKAAVAADPLLSAAKEMQEALRIVREWHGSALSPEAITYIDAALAKSRGEQ